MRQSLRKQLETKPPFFRETGEITISVKPQRSKLKPSKHLKLKHSQKKKESLVISNQKLNIIKKDSSIFSFSPIIDDLPSCLQVQETATGGVL